METNLNARIGFVSRTMRQALREINIASFLQVDTLAPEQYQQDLRGRLFRQPEQALMFAVLKDAIYCFQRYPSARARSRMRLYLEARKWLMEEDSDWPFSFASICSAFGLSPQHLRAGLLRHQETTERRLSTRTPTHAHRRRRDKRTPWRPRYHPASTH